VRSDWPFRFTETPSRRQQKYRNTERQRRNRNTETPKHHPPPMLFSIITPGYNAREKLDATFESVMTQEEGLFDYWLIDGASTDGTRDWLETRKEPAFHWISEKDSGVYDAMNKGIAHSEGRFLLFLGAGDLLLPGALRGIADFIQATPSRQPRLIYGDVHDMQTGQPLTHGRYSKSRICRENICHQGIFYERGIFERLGNYELQYPIMADWAFNLRCFGDSRIDKLHYPRTVAAFEGGGLCFHTADRAFFQDQRRLIAERIGPGFALYHRMERAVRWRLERARWVK
jgi:glycosyltransferase involved in cell wall biosynthesis